MTRTRIARALALACIACSAVLAYAAVGNGDIVGAPPVTVVTVTSPTGSGSGTATLENTSANTYSVLVDADATCDPDVTFNVAGGNPIASFLPSTTRNIAVGCPPRGTAAMQRCLFHATNNSNGTPLADFSALCLYGQTPPTLAPAPTALDFGSIAVGEFAEQSLTITNNGAGTPIRRVYLASSDIDGNFQFTAPCNPDGAYCDVDLTSEVAPGGSFAIGIKCRPQAAGTHTAQVYVGTDTFQLLSLGVTLTCTGTATTAPALAMSPTTIEIPAGVEVAGGTASTTVHLANPGGANLIIRDVRIVDVDTGAAEDWTYSASGDCSGQIKSACTLEPGEKVAINLTFDPSQIGSRRAALLVSYRDTLDRTTELPLDATGLGATLRRIGGPQNLTFGMVPVGRSAQIELTLANDGNRDTTVLANGTTPPFNVMPAAMFDVSPGAPQTLTVQCAPTAPGVFTTSVSIASPDVSQPLTVNATCEGITEPLYATPSSLLLGDIRLGTNAPTVTVDLASTAGVVTLRGEPTLESPNAAVTLGPLSQLTTPASFEVTVAPQTNGSTSATILVETTDDQVLRIPLAATAVDAEYVAADTFDLGTFCVDEPTTSSNLTLLSTGTATIELMAPELGQSPSPFALQYTTPTVYPHLLAASRPAVVAIKPHRQRTATTVSDTLTWRTDVAGAATTMTALSARFIDSGGAIAPPALNFGEVTVHLFTANGQRVVIQNCNPTPLVLDPPNIRTPFSIDSPNFPSMLNPNESVAFSVGFHPTRVGTVMDTLRITSPQLPGAPLEVLLIGTGGTGNTPTPDAGIDPMPPPDSCGCQSSQNPAGVLVIALAVLVVLFGPRRFGLR